jgi:hypothetical protein
MFLNLPDHHEGAYILARVTDPGNITGQVSISDCFRTVVLEFPGDDYSRDNSVHKLDLLIDTLTGYREAFIASAPPTPASEEAES